MQGTSQFIFCSYENRPVASNGQFMEVPLLPNHIYVIYPTEDSTGDKGRVAYAEKMPLGLDSKYPFYSIFEPPVIARASSPGPRNVSTNKKVEQVRNLIFC